MNFLTLAIAGDGGVLLFPPSSRLYAKLLAQGPEHKDVRVVSIFSSNLIFLKMSKLLL